MGHVGNRVHHVGVWYRSVRDVSHVTHGRVGLFSVRQRCRDSLTHGRDGRFGRHGDRRGRGPPTGMGVGLRRNWI